VSKRKGVSKRSRLRLMWPLRSIEYESENEPHLKSSRRVPSKHDSVVQKFRLIEAHPNATVIKIWREHERGRKDGKR